MAKNDLLKEVMTLYDERFVNRRFSVSYRGPRKDQPTWLLGWYREEFTRHPIYRRKQQDKLWRVTPVGGCFVLEPDHNLWLAQRDLKRRQKKYKMVYSLTYEEDTGYRRYMRIE